MRLRSSRRLTGPNLSTAYAAAAADIEVPEATSQASVAELVAAWQDFLVPLCAKAGLGTPVTTHRVYPGGMMLTLKAPVDQLYAAIDLNDFAIKCALADAALDEPPELFDAFAKEARPKLIAMQKAAQEHGVPFLWDDDHVSVGHGQHATVWDYEDVPPVDAIDWQGAKGMPIALITGTNGKTTSSRMLTRILVKAGRSPGNTSTDGVSVAEKVIEGGDWTGPGAARMVLRHPEVDVAVLETARGGILRRGLGVDRADVALITNVSNDHLGDYGVNTVEAMAQVKAIVGTVVHPQGAIVLCADDPHLRNLKDHPRFVAPIVWFSIDPESTTIRAHRKAGGEAWGLENGKLMRYRGQDSFPLMDATMIPASLGGAAPHNVQNALGAAATASALGVADSVIVTGLESFGKAPTDNPGRADLRRLGPLRVLSDFGHNPHGLDALMQTARNLLAQEPGRLWVTAGQAGDRSREDVDGFCQSLAKAEPDRVMIREIKGYERGRAAGEMPRLFAQCFERLGLGEKTEFVDGEVQALERALKWAQPGDLLVLTVHMERDAVAEAIRHHTQA